MTTATLRRMGNSLGFTVPAEEVKRLGLHEGDTVDVEIQHAAGWADLAGALKGRLGSIDALTAELDAADREAEGRKWSRIDGSRRR